MTPPRWFVRDREIDLSRSCIMGILNVTPDSFSDGGLHADAGAAMRRAETMVREGADILDVGGESTRPGAEPVPAAEEIRRVVPVVRAAAALGVFVSVDTGKAEVARAALDAGAAIVNDVTALGDPRMAETVRAFGAGLVLMHMRGTPSTMQDDPRYDDVVREVSAYLAGRRDAAEAAGVARERIVLDPGLGFGKTTAHNVALVRRLDALCALGSPVLIGASRKRFLGALTGVENPGRRVIASVAAAVAARLGGASVLRVHDVAATVEALRVADAVRSGLPQV